MKRYGQFCPIAKAAEVFCERWTPLILRDLAFGASRFSELQRGVPLASPTLLSHRLKQLEKEGIVQRRRSATGQSWSYHLTPAGEDLTPIVLSRNVGSKVVAPRTGQTRDRSRALAVGHGAWRQAGGVRSRSNRRAVNDD